MAGNQIHSHVVSRTYKCSISAKHNGEVVVFCKSIRPTKQFPFEKVMAFTLTDSPAPAREADGRGTGASPSEAAEGLKNLATDPICVARIS